uniref:hypothetical protein n=1 Tax=Granulicatella adiacens TaxID=46124 RepID=UPI00241E01B3
MSNYEFILSITKEFEEICWDTKITENKYTKRNLYLEFSSTHQLFFNEEETKSKKKISFQTIKINDNIYY